MLSSSDACTDTRAKGKAVASDLVNNLKGSGTMYIFHTFFIAKIKKVVQNSRGTMTKSRKTNSDNCDAKVDDVI